jgi:lysophospholipase L1-like esterase
MAVPVLIGQSPKLIPTSSFGRRHALRIAQAAGWCARNNIAFVNVHRAFMDAGVPLSDLVDPDLTHPTTAGNIVWGNAIINSYLNGEF